MLRGSALKRLYAFSMKSMLDLNSKHLTDKVSLTLKMQPFSCDLQIMGRLLPASDLYVASWTSKDNQANFRADKI